MNYSVVEVSAGGYVWEIDAFVIANNKANYYYQLYLNRGYSDTEARDEYDTEYKLAIEESYELTDWYSNNMFWSDIPNKNKRLISSPEPAISPEQFDEIDLKAK